MSNETTKTAVPKLRFPEFEGVGEWEITQLGKIGKFTGGGTPSKEKEAFWQGSIPWISSSDISEDSVHQVKITRFITDEALKESATKLISKNSILLVSRVGVGKLAITTQPVCTSQDFTNFTPLKENLVFLAYYLKTQSQILLSYSQGMAIKGFTKEDVSTLKLFLPRLSEQQKIAATLSSLDDLLNAQNAKLAALQEHKRGLMQGLFPTEGETVPKLRFPEFQDAAEWEEKQLGKLAKKVGSGITPTGGDKNYKTHGVPFVRSQNIGWGKLLLDDVAFIDEKTHATFPATEINKNDVLLNITGASIGRCAVADSRIVGGNVNQHVCIIRTTQELHPFFLSQYLIAEGGQNQIDSFQAGGNRQGLNFVQIRSFQIPVPPTLEEQQKIADCLSSLDNRITAQTQKIEALKLHKKGLMQGLFPAAAEPTA